MPKEHAKGQAWLANHDCQFTAQHVDQRHADAMQLRRGFFRRRKWIVEVRVDELEVRRICDGSLDRVPTTIVRDAERAIFRIDSDRRAMTRLKLRQGVQH